MIPAGIPMRAATTKAASASSSVCGNLAHSSSQTGCRVRVEIPRSPCNSRPRKVMYWTGKGWSSPNSRRTCSTNSGVACTPAIATAGSPGRSRTIRNTKVTAPNSVGRVSSSLQTTYRHMALPLSLKHKTRAGSAYPADRARASPRSSARSNRPVPMRLPEGAQGCSSQASVARMYSRGWWIRP